MVQIKTNGLIIGAFYEMPNGKIAYLYGCGNGVVNYHLNGWTLGKSNTTFSESVEVVKKWKLRNDLADFPNSLDARLPYVFDLLWDIKYISQLREHLKTHEDEEILSLMREYNISL